MGLRPRWLILSTRWVAIAAVALFLASGLGTSSATATGTPVHAVGAAPSILRGGHPWAIPVGTAPGRTSLHTTHYWAGAYFTGTTFSPTRLSATVHLPDAIPNSQEFYYVLLSVWDSAGSYDQVGFTNDGGTWGFTYSYTSACAGTYYYNPAWATLTRGTTYTFSMNLSSTGQLTFTARQASGAHVYTLTKHSGGTSFLAQSYYTCSSGTYYDLTDYEEIYDSVQAMPSYDFFFGNNTANTSAVTAWSTMSAPPGGGQIGVSGAQVSIENEAFWMAFNGTNHVVKVPKGTTNYTASVSVFYAFSGTNVTLQLVGPTSAFKVTFTPASAAPGFNATVLITPTGALARTRYTLTLEAVDGNGAFTYVTLWFTIK